MSIEKLNKIKDKINKLLALGSKNDNKEEAMSALTRARELMIKYNIEDKDLPTNEKKIIYKITDISIKLNWKKHVAVTISEYLKIKVYIQSGKLAIYGYEQDVNLAEIFMKNIMETANNQAKKYISNLDYNISPKQQNILKNDFILAFADSIANLWETQNKQYSNALILVTSKEVNDNFERHTSNYKTRTPRVSVYNDNSAIESGRQAGLNYINQKAILN